MHSANPHLISYLLTGLAIAVVLVLRLRGLTRERRLRLELMWILPTLLLAMTAALFLQYPPRGADWAWLAAIFTVGGAIGWIRGRLIAIAIDPDTHQLNTRPSPAALIFLLALFAIRFGARAYLEAEATSWRLSTVLITDGFVVLAVGLFAASRIEMALRAWDLLRHARMAKAATT